MNTNIIKKLNIEEQEVLINIDYSKRETVIYSSKKEIIIRINKRLGEPDRVFTTKGQITGAEWRIPFEDKKKTTSILSRPLLIGNRK